MNSSPDITAEALRDYAKSKGWQQVQEAVSDRLYVLNNSNFSPRQLVFPIDDSVLDYQESVLRAASKLSDLQGIPLSQLLDKVLEAPDDALQLRFSGVAISENYLPFSFTRSAIKNTEQLWLSGAHTVLNPQVRHPRLNRKEAGALLESTKFCHTGPGSFIFKISCPVYALSDQISLPVETESVKTPFVRRTTLTIKRALKSLVAAIESDTIDKLIETTLNEDRPLISSNFCEALSHFQDDTLKNSLDITVSWSAVLPPPIEEANEAPIRIQRDYFPRIEQIYRALQSTERVMHDNFVGTVEELEGVMGERGREGNVILQLFSKEGDTVRVKVQLNAEQYQKADQAHMSSNAFIRVNGKIAPGRQPRILTDIESFDLL